MENNRSRHIDTAYIILRDILKNWFKIICIALSTALLAYIVASVCYVPKYTSRCTMIVSAKVNNTGTYADTAETEKLTDTINAVMNSSVLKAKTAEVLGMEYFDGSINVNVIQNTNMLEIDVTSSNPNTAFRLLKTMLDIYPELSKDVLGEIVMEVFEEPNFPTGPSNEFIYKRIMNLSFLIAACAVILIITAYAYMSNTVKNEWDATEQIDAKLLGVLYHEPAYRNLKTRLLRQKKRLLMCTPSISFGFSETIKKIRTNLSYFQEKHGGNVILITSYGKGEGKSTIATNLAFAFAQRNQKVLLISGSASNDIFKILNITPPEIANGTKASLSDMIYTKNKSYLSVLVNTKRVFFSEDTQNFITKNELNEFLNESKNTYDYILIDGPCTKNSANTEIFASMADFSLLVVKQHCTKVPLINDTVDMLNCYNNGLAGYVLNNVYSSSGVINIGYNYGYSKSGKYGNYGKYGRYGKYGSYGKYSSDVAHGAHYQHGNNKTKRDVK